MSRRKFREQKSKFYGTKQVLQDLNAPAHTAVHDLDPTTISIPAGGLESQVLVKLSDDDYDVGWADAQSLFPAEIDGGDATSIHDTFLDGDDATGASFVNTLDGGDATS